MMKANLPMQIMAVSKLNDPIAVRKRVALSLPEPRVSDTELDEIVKLGAQAQSGTGSESTAGAHLKFHYHKLLCAVWCMLRLH